MKYKRWEFRNGVLLLEKYSGPVNLEGILENERDIFTTKRDESQQLLALSDISEALLEDLKHDDIMRLFEVIDAYAYNTNGMKIALYTGNMNFEDFQKAYAYVEEAAKKPLSMISFNYLDLAMNWLGLTKEEQASIQNILLKESTNNPDAPTNLPLES